MVSFLVFFLCLIVFYFFVFVDLLLEFVYYVVLDLEEKMKFYWIVDWDVEVVFFVVEVGMIGWVGFGFFDFGQMIGSDIVIGWVKDNKGYFKVRKSQEIVQIEGDLL